MRNKSKYLFSWSYLLLLLVVIIAEVFWLLNKTGFFYQEPKYEVTLFPEFEELVLEASESAQLAISKEDLLDQLSAEAIFVLDNTTQTIVLEKNPQLPLPPASTTKLMTVFTALKNYDLNEVVTVSTDSALKHNGGGLYPLEQVKVKDLAAAALVRSANDAAYALADHFNGGYEEFINEMNHLAGEIYLDSSRFANPVGYDHPDNISTARDLGVLTSRVFKEQPIAEWMSLKNYVVENVNNSVRHFLFSTNELLGKEEGVIAGKTGTTPMAKEVLVSIVELDGHQYIIVVMSSEDRYVDTKMLIQWIKDNVSWRKVEFPLQINEKSL